MSETRPPTFRWYGRPVYRCQFCPYERVENLEAVLEHERDAHPSNVPVPMRDSQIVGHDGQPLQVPVEAPTPRGRRQRKVALVEVDEGGGD